MLLFAQLRLTVLLIVQAVWKIVLELAALVALRYHVGEVALAPLVRLQAMVADPRHLPVSMILEPLPVVPLEHHQAVLVVAELTLVQRLRLDQA